MEQLQERKPKIFYRRLDTILSKIGRTKSDKNYFVNILSALRQEFGKDLKIKKSYVFEGRGNEYVLIHSVNAGRKINIKQVIPFDSPSIIRVLKKKRVIFSKPEDLNEFGLKKGISIAVTTVHNPVRRWIFVFELDKDWVYEELMLFLRAMRTALNYRLFSDMVGGDLERAEQIQSSLLPNYEPNYEGYLISGKSIPAEIVGGDFFEYFKFDKNDFGFAIGDASGHGLPAALLVRDVVIGLRMGLERNMRLVYTLKKLNQVIQQSTYSTNFVSLFIGEIEQGGHLFYSNAGHPPPFVVDGDKIFDLEATGITLGFLPSIELRRSYFRLNPGSVLVAYSDGIIERQKREEEMYGIERLKRLVKRNKEKTPAEIIDLIFKSVFEYGKNRQWEDDATVVVIKRTDDDTEKDE